MGLLCRQVCTRSIKNKKNPFIELHRTGLQLKDWPIFHNVALLTLFILQVLEMIEGKCISLGRITPQNSFSKFNGKR